MKTEKPLSEKEQIYFEFKEKMDTYDDELRVQMAINKAVDYCNKKKAEAVERFIKRLDKRNEDLKIIKQFENELGIIYDKLGNYGKYENPYFILNKLKQKLKGKQEKGGDLNGN